ncbi:hypothetical protein OHR86_28080 [Streptomyces sp. NBC_00441]|uniref:hypothetical protein n=1 Tax=Streptomyces sp. NBC_00441 TaxID=2975742 RepID=UPI002E2A0F0B|nr:hypothetical protein [Streptomyces sp. NBC_00441]
MTAPEFCALHGDPATWTTADHESFEVLRLNDDHLANRHTLHGGTPSQGKSAAAKAAADRLRQLLGRAA